ncbi:MAG: 2-hydroxyacyl-CoA dehydratase subunit D, partial [Fidelibacterota bacterium]
GSRVLDAATDRGYSTDTCGFHRGGIGAAMEGYLPRPLIMVSTTNFCDGKPKVYELLSSYYGREFILIDVPHKRDVSAVDYVSRQLENSILRIERATGLKFNERKFHDHISNFNKMTGYLERIDELKKHSPCPFEGDRAYRFQFPLFLLWGTGTSVKLCENLYNELKRKIDSGVSSRENIRLLWMGVFPNYKTEIFTTLRKKYHARIVCHEYCHMGIERIDEDDPFNGLARRLVNSWLLGPVENRIEHALQLVKEYGCHGVIHHSHWGCRHTMGGLGSLREAFLDRGIPFLNLDMDGMDESNYFPGQVKTRIESFMEMFQ